MIKCLIIEDQPPAQRVLQKYIEKHGGLELMGIYSDALNAIEFLQKHSVDLIFLDIHLPKISGIDFLNIVNPKPQIILTTAFQEYAIKSYEFDVLDYLLKPFSFERFVKAVTKFNKTKGNTYQTQENGLVKETNNNFIFVKSGYDYVKIIYDEILYIKADGDYTNLHTKNSKHIISTPLRKWNKILPSNYFFQVHRSVIINTNYIEKISGNVVIVNGNRLSIGRSYRDVFFENFLGK